LLELKQLRKITKFPTLILGYVAEHELKEALDLKGVLAIYDIRRAKLLNSLGKKLHKQIAVHIKIDALLGRQGILLKDLPKFVNELKKLKNITVEGVYSHFANIEDTTSFTHAQKQINTYNQAVKLFKDNGFKNFLTHISATSGILAYEGGLGKNNLARLGIGLYGMWPSKKLQNKYGQKINLKPVIRWVTHIAQIKELPTHHPIGYGLTYITPKRMKVAVIPQGYSDGYDRRLSNKGEALIRGKKCKVLGRVAMNMFVVDVSHVPAVKVEDEVVLLGTQGKKIITAEEIAEKIGTINYEITTRISPLLPRVVS
jgi:alanine racemase